MNNSILTSLQYAGLQLQYDLVNINASSGIMMNPDTNLAQDIREGFGYLNIVAKVLTVTGSHT